MPTSYIPIEGTWDNDETVDNWWQCTSQFSRFLRSNDIVQSCPTGDEFVWSGDLDGLNIFRYFSKHRHNDWHSASKALKYYLVDTPLEQRNIIAHSHGGQVVLYSAADGMAINKLITIGTPVRKDMFGIMKMARPNIKQWLHIHSNWTDFWQVFGELFDGHLGVVRDMPLADMNLSIKGVGHSSILRQPKNFHYWNDLKVIDFLKGQS